MKKGLLILAALAIMICTAIAQSAWSYDTCKKCWQKSMMADKGCNCDQQMNQWQNCMMADKDQSQQDKNPVITCVCECVKVMTGKDMDNRNQFNDCDNFRMGMNGWGGKNTYQMDQGQKSKMQSWKGLGKDGKTRMIVCVCACQKAMMSGHTDPPEPDEAEEGEGFGGRSSEAEEAEFMPFSFGDISEIEPFEFIGPFALNEEEEPEFMPMEGEEEGFMPMEGEV